MPQLGETQYYQTNTNNQTGYSTIPWAGNDPYGFQNIGRDAYTKGLTDLISKTQSLQQQLSTANPGIDVGNYQPGTTLRDVGGAGNFQGNVPNNAYLQILQQKLSDVQGAQVIH